MAIKRFTGPMAFYPIITVLSFFAFAIHLWSNHNAAVQDILPDPLDFDAQIRNQSLGFQKIYVLNLPERGDRLDAFVVSSSLTGFKAEVAPGILGATVPDKSLPSLEGLSQDKQSRNGAVGTWRAHVNFARTIVENRLASALIIEDDSDWDVRLKDQLVDFARGSRFFSTNPAQPNNPQAAQSPYGDDWDLLWLGHCAITESPSSKKPGDTPPEQRHGTDSGATGTQQRYLIENDPTVARPYRRLSFHTVPNLSNEKDTTRAVFRTDYGICLYAYALSYQGAQKVLRAQAMRKSWAPIDLGIGDMCHDEENPFNCIGVFPTLVDSHKSAGVMMRDSNIDQYPADQIRTVAYTANMILSVRLNQDRLLKGEEPLSQWQDDPPPPLDPGPTRHRVVDLPEGQNPNWIPNGSVFADDEEQRQQQQQQ